VDVEEILAALRAIVEAAEGRDLTDEEATNYERLEAQLAAARRSAEIRNRQTAYQTPVPLAGGPATVQPVARTNPLAYTGEAAAGITAALRSRTRGRYAHDLDAAGWAQIQNAALTTGTYGQGTRWAAGNGWRGPRVLHVVAGVGAVRGMDAILAEFPQFTLPTATAAASEGSSLAEYATSAGGTATLGRFGRFTDFTAEGQVGTSVAPVLRMHSLGIALDLDKALIDLVDTAAGSPVAFSADVPAAIRKAMAGVMAATAAEDPADLVVLVHPDNVALLQDVTPIGGDSIGERFQRFSGALVYPTTAQDTGLMVVANLRVGAIYFEAQPVTTATDEAVKTGTLTAATAVIGGYGVSLADGFAVEVDVVTP
jgi:hypothetical protein